MNLKFYFDYEAAGNPYFREIYHGIFNRFKLEHPEYNIVYEQPDYQKIGISWGSPGGMSNFQIINEDNNKTIVVSFWDRGMELLIPELGWAKYKIVQYIGGLGMSKTSEQIKKDYDTEHCPYQYPLGVPNSYNYIDELRAPYDPEKKIRKAIFIGSLHGTRSEFYSFLKNHELIEMYSNDSGYYKKDYFNKIKNYRISLSFNGYGELAMRDFESMGLNIPVIRSKMSTQFYNKFIPDHHYISSTEPCSEASCSYRGTKIKDLADQIVYCIENNIDNFGRLKTIADNGYDYFNSYSRTNYITDLFFKIVKLDLLK